jgi:ribosomal protein S18 acetylase RimI-like enzyme
MLGSPLGARAVRDYLGNPKWNPRTIPQRSFDVNREPSESAIRAARITDLPTVETIVREAYEGYVERIGRPPAPMSADYGRLIGAGLVHVLEADGDTAGLVVLIVEPDHLLVENVAVSPAFQGRGLGWALMAFAEQQAAANGLDEVRLYTNEAMTENLRFYPSLGYEETGRVVEDGFARVYFTKQL